MIIMFIYIVYIMQLPYVLLLFLGCVVRYVCLSCSIDLVSICANKKIYNNNNVVSSAYINM